jgi:hypothetical protein
MKISITEVTEFERRDLFQKLRLKRPSELKSVRIALSFSGEDLVHLPALDRKALAAWAGPRLSELVSEIGRAGRSPTAPGELSIAAPVSDEADAAALRRRAVIFGELVRFGIAERRLAHPRPPAP